MHTRYQRGDAVMSTEVTAQSPAGRWCAGGTGDNTYQRFSVHFLQFCRRREVEAEVNEPGRLAINATNQVGAREGYREGGKALQASPLREIGRGSNEQNRRQWLYFRKGKKKLLLQQFSKAPGAAPSAVTSRHISEATGYTGSCPFFPMTPTGFEPYYYRPSGLKIPVVKLEICIH